MTAGTRPSRRTERAAPLPVPLRVTAASFLIAAMMMSLTVDRASASRGVGTGAKGRLIGEERQRGKRWRRRKRDGAGRRPCSFGHGRAISKRWREKLSLSRSRFALPGPEANVSDEGKLHIFIKYIYFKSLCRNGPICDYSPPPSP